jgi:hypothetical protein
MSSSEDWNIEENMKRQKIFFNDLLALALAGIVSLLFTHGITQFVNSYKKHEQSAVSMIKSVDIMGEVSDLSQVVNDVPSMGYGVDLNCNLFVHERSLKILRQVTFDIAWDWKRVKLPQIHVRHQFVKVKEVLNPLIPITLCKLLI